MYGNSIISVDVSLVFDFHPSPALPTLLPHFKPPNICSSRKLLLAYFFHYLFYFPPCLTCLSQRLFLSVTFSIPYFPHSLLHAYLNVLFSAFPFTCLSQRLIFRIPFYMLISTSESLFSAFPFTCLSQRRNLCLSILRAPLHPGRYLSS